MRVKVHRLGVAGSILALLTLAGAAQAQTPSTPSTPATPSAASSWTPNAVTGVIVSTDLPADSVTIKTDAGSTMTFILADPISMRSAGKDIELDALQVGDRVRIEPTPGEMTGEPNRTATRLEVMASGPMQGSTGSPQRSVSTDRPVLGEPADAGGDRPVMPASPGSTTGRSVSTDRPVLGGSPTPSTDAGSTAYGAAATPTPTPSAPSTPPTAPSAYAQRSSTPPSSAGSSADADADADTGREEDLPATASPLPFLGVMGLVALVAGLAARATRKQHS
jgi:hypothetical protein